MADGRFFSVAGPFTIADLGRRIGAEIGGAANADKLLRDVAPLQAATPDDLAFLDNRRYVEAFPKTQACAVIVNAKLAGDAPPGSTLLITAQPYRAYALAAQAFYLEPPPAPGSAST